MSLYSKNNSVNTCISGEEIRHYLKSAEKVMVYQRSRKTFWDYIHIHACTTSTYNVRRLRRGASVLYTYASLLISLAKHRYNIHAETAQVDHQINGEWGISVILLDSLFL